MSHYYLNLTSLLNQNKYFICKKKKKKKNKISLNKNMNICLKKNVIKTIFFKHFELNIYIFINH